MLRRVEVAVVYWVVWWLTKCKVTDQTPGQILKRNTKNISSMTSSQQINGKDYESKI